MQKSRVLVACVVCLVGGGLSSAGGAAETPSADADSVAAVSAAADSAAAGSAAADSAETDAAGTPQRDAMDVMKALFGRDVDPKLEGTTKLGVSWALLPSLSYNPVYGLAVGASATGSGWTGTEPGARPTYASVSANYSTTGQIQALVRGESSTPSGDYLFKVDFRYLDTDRSTWGLGPIIPEQEEFPMHFVLNRAYTTIYRRTSGPVYVGLGYHWDQFGDIEDPLASQGSTPFSEYSGSDVTRTRASGISINLLADTRDNLGNPSTGYYLFSSFRSYSQTIGSDKNWQEFWVSARLYPYVPKDSNRMLAFWIYNWYTFGPGPYLNLPSNGWDTYGRGARGYLAGRIRATSQIYAEAEYRFPLTRDGLFGAVTFLNGTASTIPESQTFGRPDYGAGVGIRIKFNKQSRTNFALDRAWGRDSQGGWFMGMSEVF